MIATTEESLTELFTDAIIALSPRLSFKGGENWKPYDREVSGPSRTRRFRLVWEPGNLFPGGAMAGDIMEHSAVLRVRTDYAGEHTKQQHVLIDDFHQLGDALTATKATDTGVMLVTRLRVDELVGNIDDTDVVQIDHVYSVRYMRRIHL